MKIYFFSYSDSQGGAGSAAYRIFSSISKYPGFNTKLFVLNNGVIDTRVFKSTSYRKKVINFFNFIIKFLFTKYVVNKNFNFSISLIGHLDKKQLMNDKPDLIFLFNVSYSFFSIDDLIFISKLNIPIIWRLSDMWAFTGGCHYSLGCRSFVDNCNNCPALLNSKYLARFNFLKRRKIDFNCFHFITPSRWLHDELKMSNLINIKNISIIPTFVDSGIFRYSKLDDKNDNIVTVIFGSDNLFKNPRKGYKLFLDLISYLHNLQRSDVYFKFLVFGADSGLVKGNYYEIQYIGKLDHKQLFGYFQKSDVYLNLSSFDNLPNTVLESLASGIPVVTTQVGGMIELKECMGEYISLLNEISPKVVLDSLQFIAFSNYNNMDISNRFNMNYSENSIIEKYISVINSHIL